jgi:diphosphomevalonate decarboxylase
MARRVTAAAHPNLALVKYWGNIDDALNLPANPSLSVNLSGAMTVTSVAFLADADVDSVTINGQDAAPAAYERVVRHLDRVRSLAGLTHRAVVASKNDFPASVGMASSASAFAALSLAATRAAGLELDEKRLSILARKGSGSACRSIPDGFVAWTAGSDDGSSFAYQIAPPDHWDLRIVSVLLHHPPKTISSSEGHRAARTSPFYEARLAALPGTFRDVKRSLLARDFRSFGWRVEREAISMHVVAMTAAVESADWLSGIYYWQPGTLRLMHAVQAWRRDGLDVTFTLDAGPTVHLICEARDQSRLERALNRLLPDVEGRYLVSEPARGAWVVEDAPHGVY